MNSNSMDAIHHDLRVIFSEIFLRDDIDLTRATTAKDINGWDSFKQIEIILAVEERFGIRIPTREVDRFGNVGDLLDVIFRLKRDKL